MNLRGNAALHFVDRYAGIPLVASLGGIRRKHALPSTIERIGLLKTAAIGDTVLLSGVVADLRRTFQRASLVLFASESNYEVGCMLEGLDQVVEVPILNFWSAVRRVRSVALDVMLDFGSWSRTEALLSLFCRASFKVGFRTPGQHRHYGYDHAIEHSSEIHELENYRNLARTLGAKTRHLPYLPVRETGQSPKSEYAVCHLWPGGRRKEVKKWPLDRWVLLFEELMSWGLEVKLTGAPSESVCNDELIARLPDKVRRLIRNAAGMNLDRTAALLAGARLVVSVDTGVMHMAAALGTPLVALHGPSSSRRWGPLGDSAIALDAGLAGCGYISLGWESISSAPACMECIEFETVRNACHAMKERRSMVAHV